MKIIISGGLGYVGGRLSKFLAEQGHEVVALSRQAHSLPSFDLPRKLRVVHPDAVKQEKDELNGADAFIHLAAVNEHDCVKYPVKAIDVNITGTLGWLDLAKEAEINRFVYFSTAHVYGKPLQGFYVEQTVCRPVHPYAITHKCAEDYVLAYSAEKGMSNTVVRLTNAFGGPAFPTADRWTLLVNDLCKSAAKERKMTLLSDGLQQRDFVCLEDVCAATLHLIKLPGDKVAGEIYNLGGNHALSVWDMALEVKYLAEETLGGTIELVRKDPKHLEASPSLTISVEKLLKSGFSLVNNVEEEIRSTLHYFNKHA
jgi:UDP-glucose 4-epimerase